MPIFRETFFYALHYMCGVVRPVNERVLHISASDAIVKRISIWCSPIVWHTSTPYTWCAQCIKYLLGWVPSSNKRKCSNSSKSVKIKLKASLKSNLQSDLVARALIVDLQLVTCPFISGSVLGFGCVLVEYCSFNCGGPFLGFLAPCTGSILAWLVIWTGSHSFDSVIVFILNLN